MADFSVLILCVSAFFIFDNSLGMPSRKARLKVSKNCDVQKPRSLYCYVFLSHKYNDVDCGRSASFRVTSTEYTLR